MGEYIERTEHLTLAMNAGARAIENNKRLSGSIYVVDVFSDNPKEISYYEAANLLREVAEVPTAEVEPVRRGEWLLKHIGHGHYWECSKRHTNPCIYVTENTKFCPNCGARMDGGADNG